MKVLTGIQSQQIDKKAIEEMNIPSLILMENAGFEVYNLIREISNKTDKILVICGKGNNGGDGFVVARHLLQNGYNIYLVSLFDSEQLSGDAKINHDIYSKFGKIIYYSTKKNEISNHIKTSSIIVDCIFGTGLKTDIQGHTKDIIEQINATRAKTVVSVDIPSGVNADNGKIMGNAVMADYTVTFYKQKLGISIHPGVENAGKIIIGKIAIPETLMNTDKYIHNLVEEEFVKSIIPQRKQDSNKGTFGNVLTVAGSQNFVGAAFLASYAPLCVGAGYSTLASCKNLITIYAEMAPEVVFLPLEITQKSTIAYENIDSVRENIALSSAALVGPGLSTEDGTCELVRDLTLIKDKIIIWDADALNCIAMNDIENLGENSIITPHPKELSRLLNIPVDEILDDRITAAQLAKEKFNCTVVLKGSRTIIAGNDGQIYINPTGSSALAKAGSGDVLGGIIAGLAAQGLNPLNAAIAGVYVHGLAADLAAEELTEYSVNANTLLKYAALAIKKITQ